MKKQIEFLSDLIWPRLTGPTPAEPELDDPPSITNDSLLSKVEDSLRARLDDERDRATSVDSRLLPLLAMAGLIGTILTAGIPLAVRGEVQGLNDLQLALLVAPLAYIGLQLLLSLNAALSGLTRRGYATLSVT